MKSINGMAERFRTALERPEAIELPGCYDVLSAIMLEQAGFSAVFLSGYGVSASMFGNPDIGLTTLSETAFMARNVAARINVPLVVDADNGYGNEESVIRTVNELERAGAAALIMEDQVLPKKCGHTESKAIVPLAQYLRKLEVALKARQTPLAIVARTDAMDLDEGIQRARAFHAAGADVTLIDGLRSTEDARRFAEEVSGHKQINLIYGGKTPILSLAELVRIGFKVVLYSTPALFVVARVLKRSLRVLRDTHDLNAIADESITFKEFQTSIERLYAEKHPSSSAQRYGSVSDSEDVSQNQKDA